MQRIDSVTSSRIRNRFAQIWWSKIASTNDVLVSLRGDPGETFAIEVAIEDSGEWFVHGLGCTVDEHGAVRMYLVEFACDPPPP